MDAVGGDATHKIFNLALRVAIAIAIIVIVQEYLGAYVMDGHSLQDPELAID